MKCNETWSTLLGHPIYLAFCLHSYLNINRHTVLLSLTPTKDLPFSYVTSDREYEISSSIIRAPLITLHFSYTWTWPKVLCYQVLWFPHIFNFPYRYYVFIFTCNTRCHLLNIFCQCPWWLVMVKGTFGPMMLNNSENVNKR